MLGNFRAFSDTSCFRLAPLTILMGPNNSGKSTVTGSLSLLKNLNTASLPCKVRLDSGKNPFGSFDMLTCSRSKEKNVTAGYDLYNIILGEDVRVFFTFEKGRNFDAVVKNISIRHKGGNLFDFTMDQNRIHTRIGLKYFYGKLKDIKSAKNKYLEHESNFRQICSSSGSYKEIQADDNAETHVRIFQVDNELKKKNINEYLKNNNISPREYDRLFYIYGKQRILPGNDGTENELSKRAGKLVMDYAENQQLFNNELLLKILGMPAESMDVVGLKAMIKKEFPDLFDCLVLLNNPASLSNIVELLKRKDYPEWEEEFLEYDISTSRRMKGIEATGELTAAVDHNLQARFDRSAFLRSVTELSMTREGFLQAYSRNRNARILSMFCSLILEKILHDLQNDLGRSVAIPLEGLNPGMTVDFNHPLYDLMRNYSMMRGKDQFLKKWFRKLNICDDFSVETPVRGMGYFPGLKKKDEMNSLAVEGSGSTRMLMILLGIANARHYYDLRDYTDNLRYYPGTIVLEQPESGLHPSWQSKLPEIFVDSYKELGLHFLVETHSEHFINKLQYLVAMGKLESSDVVVYYLDNRGGEIKPIEITLDKGGNLSQEMPGAFLDEDDRRAMGLFKLKKIGKN